MTREEILRGAIVALGMTTLGTGQRSEEVRLSDYSVDEAHPEVLACFVFNLESHFNVSLPDEAGDDWRTVGDVVDYMQKVMRP